MDARFMSLLETISITKGICLDPHRTSACRTIVWCRGGTCVSLTEEHPTTERSSALRSSAFRNSPLHNSAFPTALHRTVTGLAGGRNVKTWDIVTLYETTFAAFWHV